MGGKEARKEGREDATQRSNGVVTRFNSEVELVL